MLKRLVTTWSCLALVGLGVAGCRESDALKAAKERAEVQKDLEKSDILVPYRTLKVGLRAAGAKDRPQGLDPLIATVDKTMGLVAGTGQEGTKIDSLGDVIELVTGLRQAKKLLQTVEEDQFPTVLSLVLKQPPPAWYGSEAEHLALAAVLGVLALSQGALQPPFSDIVFYELSRATPQPSWPAEARLLARLARGEFYARAEKRYAAEEELDAYVDEVQKLDAAKLAMLAPFTGRTPADLKEILRAVGHFARAYNRLDLGREKLAEDDIEAGLKALEALKIDNELTDWGWAILHYRRGRYSESARFLEKLAQSPFLDEAGKAEMRDAASAMKRQEKSFSLLAKGKGAGLIVRALITRAGGLENVLVALLGSEEGKKAYQRVAWIDRVGKNLNGPDSSTIKEVGGKGLDFLKGKIDQARRAPLDAKF
jgi:tetratricopeptide (TPR) repeat protein